MSSTEKPAETPKPIDPSAITSLKPVDELQLTKTYGEKRPFTGWEMPDPLHPSVNRKFGGFMQQIFCQYKTQNDEVVVGEFWSMNINGRGKMSDAVAPGYELVPDKASGSFRPKMVPVELDQFSQFWSLDDYKKNFGGKKK